MDNLVTIGILTYKRTDLLIDTIKDILSIQYKINLVIVNNNEEKDVLPELSFIGNIKNINLIYIWDKINYGVPVGRNKIIEHLYTPYLIMFDDDVLIPNINDIVRNCINKFTSNSMIGGLAFNIKDYTTKLANRFEIPHKNKNINLNNDFKTYLMIGAGHALRKDVLSEIGGYPSDFGLYGMEEIDLSFRIIASGYSIEFISNNVIYHKRSPSGRHANSYVYYLSCVNRCKIAIRYFKLRYAFSCIAVRGAYMLLKTKKIKYIRNLFLDLKLEFKKRDKKLLFDDNFYRYIKKVKGFLWW